MLRRDRYLFVMATKIKRIGILTAGGDSPGLNAAIRGVGKAALGYYGWEIVGFRDGFRGLVENRRINLDRAALSGILTIGGTILGTSRDKPHRMVIDGQSKDMTGVVRHQGNTMRLAGKLEELTHLESRVTILGYVQRGGTPSPADRILATRLGGACANLINEGKFGVMVAARGDHTEPVPLDEVAGKRKSVPRDHS
jgi:6-phosphofructokinase